jgi:hypothetical protein
MQPNMLKIQISSRLMDTKSHRWINIKMPEEIRSPKTTQESETF